MNKLKVSALTLFVIFNFCVQFAFCQQQKNLTQVKNLADSLYNIKQYPLAINYYKLAASISDFPLKKATAYYDMACCYSRIGKIDSAFLALKQAIMAGYDNKAHLLQDSDLVPLHKLSEWDKVANEIKDGEKVLNSDPAKGKFITTDIQNFCNAYDMALADTANFREIFKREYFDKASKGMNDYMVLKVSSIDFFLNHIKSAPKFYKAIREDMMKVDTYKPTFLASYVKLKSIYPDAQFPDVYFLIGAFTAGGTVSNSGLLIGTNQYGMDAKVPLDELSFRLRTRLFDFKILPNLVAHELIHYQQYGMKNDTTTLCSVIREGMADFLGEIISGNTANPVLFEWVKGKEQKIWDKFKKDMDYSRYGNWIANSQQATVDNLPDQGYWIGYEICKSYYEQAKNKKLAIYEMFHIQDYKSFLTKSKWEIKLANMSVAH